MPLFSCKTLPLWAISATKACVENSKCADQKKGSSSTSSRCWITTRQTRGEIWVSEHVSGVTVPAHWLRFRKQDFQQSQGVPMVPDHRPTQTHHCGGVVWEAFSILTPEDSWTRQCLEHHPTEAAGEGSFLPGQSVQCLPQAVLHSAEVA